MKKRQIQILMIGFLFFTMVLLIKPSYLGVIHADKPIGNTSLTVGDTLTFFSLFGTCVTVGLWLLTLKRRKRSLNE